MVPQETSLDKGAWQRRQPDKTPESQTSAISQNTQNFRQSPLLFSYLFTKNKIKCSVLQSSVKCTIWGEVGLEERKWLSSTSNPKPTPIHLGRYDSSNPGIPRVKRRTERLSCCWDGWPSESCALTLTVSKRRWRCPVVVRVNENWEVGRIGLIQQTTVVVAAAAAISPFSLRLRLVFLFVCLWLCWREE